MNSAIRLDIYMISYDITYIEKPKIDKLGKKKVISLKTESKEK